MVSFDNITIGKKIKEIRKNRAFTQDILAEKVGIDAKHLSRIECGKNSLSLNLLLKICSVLDTEPSAFFDNSINKNKAELVREITNILNQSSEEKIRWVYKIVASL